MNRRTFLKETAAAGILAGLPFGCAGPNRLPNLVVIITDDQGWGDVSLHGNRLLATPNMDRLAEEGARLARFFVSPVCAPTRASLLTGRHALRTGVHGVTRGEETMRSSEVTLAEILRQNGYATGCFGKWHNGAHFPQDPNGQGFEEFIGFCAGHLNNYFDAPLQHNGKELKSSGYIADFITDQAVRFIRKRRRRPFFCYLAYNLPHSPFQVPQKYFEKFKAAGLDDATACVYGMCESMDENIGRLIAELEALNLMQDTLIVFLGDNGPNTLRYNGNLRGIKGSAHEGGSRVPCFLHWPRRIAPGTIVHDLAASYDLLPTIIELFELPTPHTLPLDGVSLAPLLTGRPVRLPERMLFDYWPPFGSVRSERYRLIVGYDHVELYDLQEDPSETNDITLLRRDIADSLFAAYEEWWESVTQNGFNAIPTEIGHRERPVVTLPAHEARLSPASGVGIRYYGGAGWANDYIGGWTDLKAFAEWPIAIIKDDLYEIALEYRCSPTAVGVEFYVEVAKKRLTGVIREPFYPPPVPSSDRVQRKEVYEQHWRTIHLGKMPLKRGRSLLKLRLLRLPGSEAMEVKAVRLRRR